MRTRRQFIKQAVISAATLALTTVPLRFGRAASTQLDPAAIRKFRSSLKGRLILPADPVYETARRVMTWNPMTAKRPALIAQCSRGADVARSLEFAQRHDLIVAVRSGGHSFGGWSTCDDGLVIDLSRMKDITVNSGKRTVRASAGVLSQELVSAAGRHRLAPVLGECPTVGIAGLTLGGGLGWLSGKYGATCDNLLSAELITADGRSIVASERQNPDLFWAIRGGGGNFGIATSFEYRLHPVNEVLAGGFTYRLADARAVLRFYRDFMAAAPDELQALALLIGAGGRLLHVMVCCSGDPKEAEKLVRPLRTIASTVRDTVYSRPFIETFTMPPYGEALPTAFSATRGCYLERLSDEAIDVALGRIGQASSPVSAIGFDHYMHGMVCRVAPDSTAFELRKPGALHVWVSSGWEDSTAAAGPMAWVDDTGNALQPYSGGRIYANFLSSEGEPAVKAAFGANYPRLVAVKNKFDPANRFRRNQNIRPAAS